MAARRSNFQFEATQQHLPQHLPHQQPESPQIVRRRVETKPKGRFYTLKMLLTVCGLGIFALMFLGLYVDTQINHVHYDIQRTRMSINEVNNLNEQLNAQIAELSQHSRIMEIATARGLTFNENNTITINVD